MSWLRTESAGSWKSSMKLLPGALSALVPGIAGDTQELQGVKQELRGLEQVWWQTHDRASGTSYRSLMRSYEKSVKTAKKDSYLASIASANMHPAQLFRTIWNLIYLPQGKQNDKELAIGCEAFVKYFADTILSRHQDLPATVTRTTDTKPGCLCPPSGLKWDHFR